MGKLFLKKSIIETLTEFAKDDYSDSEDRPRAGNFKDFFERISQEDTKKAPSKSSTPKEGEMNE